MFCRKCGNEMKEGQLFCGNCGTPISTASVQEIKLKEKKNKSKWLTVASVVFGCCLVGILVLLVGTLIKEDDSENGSASSEQEIEAATVEPLYTDVEIPTISVFEKNVTPRTKEKGMKWDSSLFYWLEDISKTSAEDGYLAKCVIRKALLRNAETGNLIQYEIYLDPNTEEIYKIVSIEMIGDRLELVDYYYQDGVPNFIFLRTDSIYTPTYATPDKVGQRFYLNNDVMVRWRRIDTPSVINEYVLNSKKVSYSQANYFDVSDEIRVSYDEVEGKWLNAAYNTYNALVNQQSVGYVKGTVRDTTETAVANVRVEIYSQKDDVLLYRTITDENGNFELKVYLDGMECYMVVRGVGDFQDNIVYGINLKISVITLSFDNIVLHRASGDKYPVDINVFAAADVKVSEDGELIRKAVKDAIISIRKGAGIQDGEILLTVQPDADGNIRADLESGTYTAQINAEGYAPTYAEIIVSDKATVVESYVIPTPSENQMGVVLVWDDTEVDLDLTLFTPFQAAGGDMAHIGGMELADEYGNKILTDNTKGCEVMYINTAEQGSYKIYVNDYLNSVNGLYSAEKLATINIYIYIYDINGFVTVYTCPKGQNGVVWEVVEISGNQLTPSQRIYSQVEGKTWWTEDKYGPTRMVKEAIEAYKEWAVSENRLSDCEKKFSLIYLNSDEIPECLVWYEDETWGTKAITVLSYDGKIHQWSLGGNQILDVAYIEKCGELCVYEDFGAQYLYIYTVLNVLDEIVEVASMEEYLGETENYYMHGDKRVMSRWLNIFDGNEHPDGLVYPFAFETMEEAYDDMVRRTETAEANKEAEEVYMLFLNNEIKAEYGGRMFTIAELLNLKGEDREVIYYGFFDCRLDGIKDLAIKDYGFYFSWNNEKLQVIGNEGDSTGTYPYTTYAGMILSGEGTEDCYFGNVEVLDGRGNMHKVYYYDSTSTTSNLKIDWWAKEGDDLLAQAANEYEIITGWDPDWEPNLPCDFFVYTIGDEEYYQYEGKNDLFEKCLRNNGVEFLTSYEINEIIYQRIVEIMGAENYLWKICDHTREIEWYTHKYEN